MPGGSVLVRHGKTSLLRQILLQRMEKRLRQILLRQILLRQTEKIFRFRCFCAKIKRRPVMKDRNIWNGG